VGQAPSPAHLESDFSPHDFDTMAANADILDHAGLSIRPDKNLAGPFHFEALFYEDALVRRRNAVHPPADPVAGSSPL